jgi:hypothetical protein
MSSSIISEEFPGLPNNNEPAPIIETVNIVDSRIADCKETLPFAVSKGAVNITSYEERAASVTTSGVNVNLTVPTMSTLVDRVIYIKSNLTIKLSGVLPVGVKFSQISSLAPFPFQSMCSNIQTTINQQSFSFNAKQLMPMVMRLLDKKMLDYYGTLCPTQQDVYASYLNQFESTILQSLQQGEEHPH